MKKYAKVGPSGEPMLTSSILVIKEPVEDEM
jgi:hypothetical protein